MIAFCLVAKVTVPLTIVIYVSNLAIPLVLEIYPGLCIFNNDYI